MGSVSCVPFCSTFSRFRLRCGSSNNGGALTNFWAVLKTSDAAGEPGNSPLSGASLASPSLPEVLYFAAVCRSWLMEMARAPLAEKYPFRKSWVIDFASIASLRLGDTLNGRPGGGVATLESRSKHRKQIDSVCNSLDLKGWVCSNILTLQSIRSTFFYFKFVSGSGNIRQPPGCVEYITVGCVRVSVITVFEVHGQLNWHIQAC